MASLSPATAVALGDPGPRHDGRLTFNPFAHLDILGGISAVLFSVGWIKPIAIDPAELRPGRAGLAARGHRRRRGHDC